MESKICISDSSLPEADQACMTPSTSSKGSNAAEVSILSPSSDNSKDKPIIISDSELEEGEIEGDAEEKEEVKKISVKDRLTFVKPPPDDADDLQNQTFEWSELNILMVGDERVVDYNWKEWEHFPSQEIYHKPFANLEGICMLADRHLHHSYDVLMVVGFHYDMVDAETSDDGDTIQLKDNIDYSKIANTVSEYQQMWKKTCPGTLVVWTIPHPPNFLEYNLRLTNDLHDVPNRFVSSYHLNKQTLRYYEAIANINNKLRALGCYDDMIIFNLGDVLFETKPYYEKTFQQESDSPKFPEGFLESGFHPSKLMVMNTAYLLIEHLHFVGCYPQQVNGLDMDAAEKQLIQMYPKLEPFLEKDAPSKGKSRRSRSRERHTSSDSASHRSSSRYHSKHSHSRHSRSSHRKSKKRKHCHKHHRSKKRRRYSSSHSPTVSRSPFKEELLTYSKLKQQLAKSQPPPTSPKSEEKSVNSEEEAKFWKMLRSLRSCHEIECNYYRQNPVEHPEYTSEKNKFLVKMKSALLGSLVTWDSYWNKKSEEIFLENWTKKNAQLRKDFQNLHNSDEEIGAYLSIASPTSSKRQADVLSSKMVLTSSFDFDSSVEMTDCQGALSPTFAPLADDSGPNAVSSPIYDHCGAKPEKNKFTLQEYLALKQANAEANKTPTPKENKDGLMWDKLRACVSATQEKLQQNDEQTPNDHDLKLSKEKPFNDSYFAPSSNAIFPIFPKSSPLISPSESSPALDVKPTQQENVDSPPIISCPNSPEPGTSVEDEKNSEMDIDIDKIFENPDVLKGLEDIDGVLNNAFQTDPAKEYDNSFLTDNSAVIPNRREFDGYADFAQTRNQVSNQVDEDLRYPQAHLKYLKEISNKDPLFNLEEPARQHAGFNLPKYQPNVSQTLNSFSSLNDAQSSPSRSQYDLYCNHYGSFTDSGMNSAPVKNSNMGGEVGNANPNDGSSSHSNFIPIIKLLHKLSKHLGPLGASISSLYYSTLDSVCKGNNGLDVLDSDGKALLELTLRKLTSSLKEDITEVQKAILREASDRLKSFLSSLDHQNQQFPKIQVRNIAKATVGQNVTQIVLFIKKMLLYHDYTNYSNEDVMKIYMSVRSHHLEMMNKNPQPK